jgi:soluble lytic murein transglycosylase-like protein
VIGRAFAAALLAAVLPVAAGADGIRSSRSSNGTLVLTNEGSARVSVPRTPRRREPTQDLALLIDRHARERGLDPVLVQAVIQAESAYDARAVSKKGAIGLMQLMPETARELGVDPWDPEQNVRGGTLYLRRLIDSFGGDLQLALAGYNAGPGAVSRVLALYHGRPVAVRAARSAPARSAAATGSARPSRVVRVQRDAEGRRVFSTPE